MEGFQSGFVGVIGRTNVGKSTIVNYFVGSKVAIVSPRPQTTRKRITGILHLPQAQLAFLDTPGFHRPEHGLGRSMLEAAKAVLDQADVLLAVVDAQVGLREDDRRFFSHLKGVKRPVLLAINKVDAVKKPRLLPLIEYCAKLKLFEECVPVSAKTGEQMNKLLELLLARLPEGPSWYEAEQSSDQPLNQQLSELIREQALIATHQEVPQAIAVLIDEVVERQTVTVIRATFLVERPGQKAILIGQGGSMLKRIGQSARRELEGVLKRQVYLDLWVKVRPGWRSDTQILKDLGYYG